MTAIVGVQGSDGKVWIGADSHVAAGCETFPMTDVERKVFRRVGTDALLFGVAGSTRIRQLLEHQLLIPEHPEDIPTHVYLVKFLMPAIKAAVDQFGGVHINNPSDGWDFLLGYRGQLWYGCHDLSVSLMPEYGAVGCGHMVALGSLHMSYQRDVLMDDQLRVRLALAAAEHHDAHVAAPFQIESVG